MAECSSQEKTTTGEDKCGASVSVSAAGKLVPKVDGAVAEDDDQDDAENTPKVTSVATPLLIEEIEGESVPESYALLLGAVNPASSDRLGALSKYDVVVLFVYVIMLEQGFVPVHCSEEYSNAPTNLTFDKQRVRDLCARLPSTWRRSKALYEFAFVLGPFRHQRCRLLCTICMDDLLVNCSVHGVENANYSMLVDPSQYVIESRYSLGKRYQHVKQFAMSFKNAIANRAKWDILEANDVQSPRLQDLPPELKYELEKFVKAEFFNDL